MTELLLHPRDLPGRPLDVDQLDVAYHDAGGDPLAEARVVWWALRHDPDLERSTADRLGACIARFGARQRALGGRSIATTTPDEAEAFVWARTLRQDEPAIATAHLRRTALRLAFRVVARFDDRVTDPTRGLVLPAKTRRDFRPLDDDEIGLLRIAAAGRTRGRDRAIVTVALAEATATTGEIGTLRWRDVDDATVALPGAGAVAPRRGVLTPWGAAALDRYRHDSRSDPADPIVYQGTAGAGSHPSQAVVVNRLTHLLRSAGLDGDDIRPTSVRLWRPARDLAAGGRIEDAARALGLSSLDVTAAQLCHDWLDPKAR